MTKKIDTTNLPEIIFLYGPAGSGKGTQAELLLDILDNYIHLEFGSSLRDFVLENLNSSDEEQNLRAVRMKSSMDKGLPVPVYDLRFVIERKINDILSSGKKIILDGAGRSIEEAKWQSGFIKKSKFKSCIFHLYIALDETIYRATHRWYIPGSKKPFISFDEAKKVCSHDKEPFQRNDDTRLDSIKTRYKKQYREHVAEILKTYQVNSGTNVFLVDGNQKIPAVARFIKNLLVDFYN